LTLDLGYRYLWIDRYCIDQDDMEEKAQQTAQMDDIYAGSDVTIIAADSSDGLSGVTARQSQSTLTMGGAEYVVQPPTPRYAIGDSRWSERAWTYQEAVLAKRHLVIRKPQSYFSCLAMHCCETIEGPLQEKRTGAQSKRYRWDALESLHTLDSTAGHT